MKTHITALAALLILGTPLAAAAQNVPSYATSAYGDDQQIRGRIANFDGGYNLQVRDDQGYVDNVQLHDGTIINPTGLTLAPGMVVSIIGYNAGNFFGANEVDTPYSYDAGVPYYSGHPWNYYGSGITLGFFFGNTGWWHGNDFTGGYSYDRGVRVYSHANFRNLYNGGNFQGRNYVAPVARGGYARGQNRTNVTTNRTVNRTTIDRNVTNTYSHPVTNNNVTTTRNSNYQPRVYTPARNVGVPQTHYVAPQGRVNVQNRTNTAPRTFSAPRGGGAMGGGARPAGGHVGGGGAPHGGAGGGAPHGGGGGDHGGGNHH